MFKIGISSYFGWQEIVAEFHALHRLDLESLQDV